MLVLSSYRPSGQKMVGFFGQGDPRAVWAPIAVLALQGVEPDWNALGGAPPLDPMFNRHRSEAPAPPLVERDEGRAGIYAVRLPQDALHYVLVKLEDHLRVFYCTCSPDEEAPSPSCAHTQAVRALLQERDERARERQGRGLLYLGGHLEDGRYSVTVWEEGRPSLLDSTPSQRLRNHSPSGFDWGYGGSGPAQLALALLLDFSGDEELALKHHQAFKARVIASLPQDTPGRMKGMDISDFLRAVSNSRE